MISRVRTRWWLGRPSKQENNSNTSAESYTTHPGRLQIAIGIGRLLWCEESYSRPHCKAKDFMQLGAGWMGHCPH